MSSLQLTLRSGPGKGHSWSLAGETLTIGRDADCDVILPHRSVSRRHCVISIDGSKVYLRDLNSRNGTLVNGRPVNTCRVKVGDELALGEVSLIVTGDSRIERRQPAEEQADQTMRVPLTTGATVMMSAPESPVRGLPQNLGDMARLFRVCRGCGAVESLGALLQLVEEEVRERLCPGRYWLARRGPQGLEILNWFGGTGDEPEVFFPFEHADRILLSGEGKIVLRHSALHGQATHLSTMLAAISLSGAALGIIVVEEAATQREYNDTDLEFLAALCFAIAPFIKLHDRKQELEAEVARYRAEASRSQRLVGSSEAIERVRLLIRLVAQSNQSILITGETGTGKDLVARAIHGKSDRARGPFVAVNCAAIPAELFESEVFGHERGAFTGATGRRIGLLQESDGGTLFLDEVGDLSPSHQARILRALETQTFRRVGGDRDINVDFRVLAATNRDLSATDSGSSFRADLFHRLRGFEIHVPTLRERREDIPELANLFLEEARANARRPIRGFTTEALAYLKANDWPGNVRELRQCVHSSVTICQDEFLDEDLIRSCGFAHVIPPEVLPTLAELERGHIERVLRQTHGKVAEAAVILGIARSTLYEKLRQLDIKR